MINLSFNVFFKDLFNTENNDWLCGLIDLGTSKRRIFLVNDYKGRAC